MSTKSKHEQRVIDLSKHLRSMDSASGDAEAIEHVLSALDEYRGLWLAQRRQLDAPLPDRIDRHVEQVKSMLSEAGREVSRPDLLREDAQKAGISADELEDAEASLERAEMIISSGDDFDDCLNRLCRMLRKIDAFDVGQQ